MHTAALVLGHVIHTACQALVLGHVIHTACQALVLGHVIHTACQALVLVIHTASARHVMHTACRALVLGHVIHTACQALVLGHVIHTACQALVLGHVIHTACQALVLGNPLQGTCLTPVMMQHLCVTLAGVNHFTCPNAIPTSPPALALNDVIFSREIRSFLSSFKSHFIEMIDRLSFVAGSWLNREASGAAACQ